MHNGLQTTAFTQQDLYLASASVLFQDMQYIRPHELPTPLIQLLNGSLSDRYHFSFRTSHAD